MIKVMTIVGTRPEIIRLSRTISKLDQFCEHTLIHTGQNYDYELNEVFFNDLGIRRPDMFLEAAGKNAAETIGQVIISADQAMEKFKPDALLLLGDTNSSLSAIPAKRQRFQFFIWKLEIVLSISVFLKKSIAALLTTSRTLT